MYKKLFYNEVVRVLNLNTASVTVQGGYIIGIYGDVPQVVDQSSTNQFDFARIEVVPMAEEIAQETPSVVLADRSDYIFQYKIMFRSSREDDIETMLDEFRTYFITNKQVVIGGYKSAVKTSRGDKLGTIKHAGTFWTFYSIKVYVTAIKNGYIKKDTDVWKIKLYEVLAGSFIVGKSYQIVSIGTTDFTLIGASANTVGVIFTATGVGSSTGTAGTAVMTTTAVTAPTTYQTLSFNGETFGTNGNVIVSNKLGVTKGLVSGTNLTSKMVIFYNEQSMEDKILQWTLNKLDKETLFNFQHTFNGENYSYVGVITGGVRTLSDNSVVLLDFTWIEADI